jgi:hypothetical protein
MTPRDLRSDLELLVAAHRYGRCEQCDWVLRRDDLTGDIHCPVAEMHETDASAGMPSSAPSFVDAGARGSAVELDTLAIGIVPRALVC